MKRTRHNKTNSKRGGMFSARRSPRKTFIEKMQPHQICNITNKGDHVSCGVYHFNCNDPNQKSIIERFAKIATKQRHFFYEIFPWKSKCKDNWQMFIAIRDDPRTQDLVICAWCSVRFQDLPATDGTMHRTAYIVEVSVRRKKTEGAVDENYRGMGIKFLQSIIKYCKTQDVTMLYLVPSNDAVKGLYVSSLHMSDVPGTSYLVKSLSDAVTVPIMRDVIGFKRSTEIAEETRLFKESLHALSGVIRKLFIKKTESMHLDDKVAILGEIEIMQEEGVPDDEIISYINEL